MSAHPSPPFRVERIDHVVFRVGDLQRSVDFYQRVLGCELVRTRTDLGLVHLRAGASMIDLVDIDGAPGKRGGNRTGPDSHNVDHVCLRIEPFDAQRLAAHFAAAGLLPTGAVAINFGAEGEGPSLYLRDPDGNAIALKGPAVAVGAAPDSALRKIP